MAAQQLRLGTRTSALARAQSEYIARVLETVHDGDVSVQLVPIRTRGDAVLDKPLYELQGKGFFTKEIEDALLRGEIDFAVHSLKDLPVQQPDGLTLVCYPLRENPADVLISRTGAGLRQLPPGARVGTSSLRRQALLRRQRPDLVIENMRGNVDTRLRRLDAGDFDTIVLAAAGLRRLGLAGRISEELDPREFPPAPGQGALALQARAKDELVHRRLRLLQHGATALAVQAERTCLQELGGGCQLPVGAYAHMAGKRLHLLAMVAAPNGVDVVVAEADAPAGQPVELGRLVAERLRQQGADAILARLQDENA